MNSPDRRPTDAGDALPLDPFGERIAAAARALRGTAPAGLFERALAAAHDADAAHATTARTLAGTAPFTFEQVWSRAQECDAFDDRIAAVARTLVQPAPPHSRAAIRAAARPRLRLLPRALFAAAASLVALLAFFFATRDGRAAPVHPALLTAEALRRANADESLLVARGDALAAQLAVEIATDATLADDETRAPLLEELAFLDTALDECRAALASSPAHRYLRDQLAQLTERRVALLTELAEQRE